MSVENPYPSLLTKPPPQDAYVDPKKTATSSSSSPDYPPLKFHASPCDRLQRVVAGDQAGGVDVGAGDDPSLTSSTAAQTTTPAESYSTPVSSADHPWTPSPHPESYSQAYCLPAPRCLGPGSLSSAGLISIYRRVYHHLSRMGAYTPSGWRLRGVRNWVRHLFAATLGSSRRSGSDCGDRGGGGGLLGHRERRWHQSTDVNYHGSASGKTWSRDINHRQREISCMKNSVLQPLSQLVNADMQFRGLAIFPLTQTIACKATARACANRANRANRENPSNSTDILSAMIFTLQCVLVKDNSRNKL